MRPPDLSVLLSIWGAGLAAGGAVVAAWKVARPGYITLVGAIVAGIGVLAAWVGAESLGLLAALTAAFAALRREGSVVIAALVTASLAFFLYAVASTSVDWLSALVGAASLGAVTSEMLLGHWFLVDPKLARWPLRRLAIAGVIGALAEGVLLIARPVADLMVSRVLLAVLAGFAGLLMIGVTLSLRGKSYAGVMAATGLSYLATLVVLAVAIIARPS